MPEQVDQADYEIIYETEYLVIRAKRTYTEGVQLRLHAKDAMHQAEQFPKSYLLGINALCFEPMAAHKLDA